MVGRGDKYCSCVWTWVNAIVCVLLTAKPCFLLALLPTAVCNFPSFVPFKLLRKESIQKAVMGSWFLKFSAFLLFYYLTCRFFNFTRINTYPGLSVPCQRCSTHIFSFPTWIFLPCLTTAVWESKVLLLCLYSGVPDIAMTGTGQETAFQSHRLVLKSWLSSQLQSVGNFSLGVCTWFSV